VLMQCGWVAFGLMPVATVFLLFWIGGLLSSNRQGQFFGRWMPRFRHAP